MAPLSEIFRVPSSCSMNSEQQSFGFLSGPIDQLKAAQTARWVQVDFGHGEIAEIRVLQVSNTGIALIAVRGDAR